MQVMAFTPVVSGFKKKKCLFSAVLGPCCWVVWLRRAGAALLGYAEASQCSGLLAAELGLWSTRASVGAAPRL